MRQGALVFQTDFGMQDGAVSAMYGVAYGVSPDLKIYDLTHGIEPYNTWEASYRLIQTVSYWPEGTVFVSVVDPGVGSTRRSIVAKTKTGQYVVTPDNGTLTFVKRNPGIKAARIIDETTNRRSGSEESYTFHGRDVYAFTGAKLAAGKITFEQVGEEIDPSTILELPTIPAKTTEDGGVAGTIDVWMYGSEACGPTFPLSCSKPWALPSANGWKCGSPMIREPCIGILWSTLTPLRMCMWASLWCI